ncbi:hypothetical protein PD5205_02597 [Xanthomonas fragariae]|uniref:Uncharacterized protein n=1 Tax=Xanthomonas fragariae TaxID=48664 RepID=A0A1Y6HKJ9_9XANT|nr:hypothetical protein PD5205_02597 [Xanthomonas fragariae]
MAHGKQVVCAAMYKLLQLADGVLKSALRLTRKERLSADKGETVSRHLHKARRYASGLKPLARVRQSNHAPRNVRSSPGGGPATAVI